MKKIILGLFVCFISFFVNYLVVYAIDYEEIEGVVKECHYKELDKLNVSIKFYSEDGGKLQYYGYIQYFNDTFIGGVKIENTSNFSHTYPEDSDIPNCPKKVMVVQENKNYKLYFATEGAVCADALCFTAENTDEEEKEITVYEGTCYCISKEKGAYDGPGTNVYNVVEAQCGAGKCRNICENVEKVTGDGYGAAQGVAKPVYEWIGDIDEDKYDELPELYKKMEISELKKDCSEKTVIGSKLRYKCYYKITYSEGSEYNGIDRLITNITPKWRLEHYSTGLTLVEEITKEEDCTADNIKKIIWQIDDNFDGDLDFGYNTDVGTCEELLGEELIAFLNDIFKIIKFITVIGFIGLSVFDFTKAIALEDKEILNKTLKRMVIRIIVLVAIFMLPTLINLFMNLLGYEGTCGIG